MKTVSAKELKNNTGEVLQRVSNGEKILVTKRGKPVALVAPVTEKELLLPGLRPLDQAWADIEKALKGKPARFKNWEEAMRWSRRRV